VVVMWL